MSANIQMSFDVIWSFILAFRLSLLRVFFLFYFKLEAHMLQWNLLPSSVSLYHQEEIFFGIVSPLHLHGASSVILMLTCGAGILIGYQLSHHCHRRRTKYMNAPCSDHRRSQPASSFYITLWLFHGSFSPVIYYC